MKTSDIGLSFDNKLSRSNWTKIEWVKAAPENIWFGTIPTELGRMTIMGDGDALCYIGFDEVRSIERCHHFFKSAEFYNDITQAEKMAHIIMDVWAGKSQDKIAVMTNGTEFQKSVWSSLMKIPMGHVVSYGTIATAIGKPTAVRAVGTAVGANPISLIIPCHRVVQQSGKVENYMWGDAMKQRILKGEASVR